MEDSKTDTKSSYRLIIWKKKPSNYESKWQVQIGIEVMGFFPFTTNACQYATEDMADEAISEIRNILKQEADVWLV